VNTLILTHRLPYAPNRGDRIRAFHIINSLATRGRVHVVSLVHDRAEEAEADTLRRLGIGVSTALVSRRRNALRAVGCAFNSTPLTHVLLDAPEIQRAIAEALRAQTPDVVLAYCSGVAPLAMSGPLAAFPLILDLVDVDSAKWANYAATSRSPRRWVFSREARCLSHFEAAAARAAFATTVVNERERQTLRKTCPEARVHVVQNGVDVASLTPREPPSEENRVIFAGVFNYAPNVEAALWFASEVWPRVLAALPDARLTLAGSHPTAAIRRLARTDSTIEVTGSVPDMRPYLWRSAMAVAPIFQAHGVQNKVLEAAAAGLPSAVTTAVWDGLPAEVLPACFRADGVDAFARGVIDCLALGPDERRRIAVRADLGRLSWPERLAPLLNLVEEAATSGVRRQFA
jgi:sugar transferase (PEP-CTERM/EpsH1 system associated)